MRKPVYALCEQERHRSACASAQSDQCLCCSLPRRYNISSFYIQNFKTLASLCSRAGRFESYLVANPEGRFSHDVAQFKAPQLLRILLSINQIVIKFFYYKSVQTPHTGLSNTHSCINIYAHSCLKPLSNPLKAVFKQLKPCLNHGIHMLFEHGFYLKILKTGHKLFTWHQLTMQGCPGISILSWFLLKLTSCHFSRQK